MIGFPVDAVRGLVEDFLALELDVHHTVLGSTIAIGQGILWSGGRSGVPVVADGFGGHQFEDGLELGGGADVLRILVFDEELTLAFSAMGMSSSMVRTISGYVLSGCASRVPVKTRTLSTPRMLAARGRLEHLLCGGPTFSIGIFREVPCGVGAGPGELEQAGIQERNFQFVGGQFGGSGFELRIGKECEFLLRLGHVAQLDPLQIVLVGEVDGVGLGLADLIGNGADAALRDVRFESLRVAGGGERGGPARSPVGSKHSLR